RRRSSASLSGSSSSSSSSRSRSPPKKPPKRTSSPPRKTRRLSPSASPPRRRHRPSPPATPPPKTRHSPTPQQSNRTRKSRVSVSPGRTSGKVTKHKGTEKRESPSPAPKPRKVELSESEDKGGKMAAADSVQQRRQYRRQNQQSSSAAKKLSKCKRLLFFLISEQEPGQEVGRLIRAPKCPCPRVTASVPGVHKVPRKGGGQAGGKGKALGPYLELCPHARALQGKRSSGLPPLSSKHSRGLSREEVCQRLAQQELGRGLDE
ncbi:hypothetical protein H8959_006294, partial [Pygathrix nigripes]